MNKNIKREKLQYLRENVHRLILKRENDMRENAHDMLEKFSSLSPKCLKNFAIKLRA